MYGSSSAQMSSGLHRYRSAPMSLLGQLCEDLIPPRPPSPETDSLMLARFLSSDLGVVVEEEEEDEIHEKKNILPPSPPPSSAQLPRQQLMMMTYQQQQQQHQIQSQNSSSSSSLINRQSSSRASPAAAGGLFDPNGYGSMEGYPAMMTPTTTTTTTTPTTSWGDDLSDNNFASGFNTKRQKTIEPTPHQSECEARNGPLNHQFSFPKTSSEMAAIDKFLLFQDSVPCKIRAKRGCATHPRSIAERVRRTRISERMRKLQDLVPNMDKQTNTADMLDLAVDYIKDLQKKVVTLSDNRASCTCSSSKQRQ